MNKSVWLLMVEGDVGKRICIGVFFDFDSAHAALREIDSSYYFAGIVETPVGVVRGVGNLKCFYVDCLSWQCHKTDLPMCEMFGRFATVWAPDAESAVERARELARGGF